MLSKQDGAHLCGGILSLAAFIALLRAVRVENPTTASLGLLVLVLITATWSRLRVAVATAIVATGAFNFYFLPPIGTLTIADPQPSSSVSARTWRPRCSRR